MATLILTAVGSTLGGPLGSAIGSIVGQQVDRMIFQPGQRSEGPRLKELEVQTSSYGTQIPAIFGVMRVAGTVIWATDLIERRTSSGGGKGQPSTTNYSYSVSLAVALSSRPISGVGRIWADGNLVRGAAGDLKVATRLRIHQGHGDQQPDPLLSSAEGPGMSPAHRGLAYVVFEELQLADFGNRIPSLTFEIFEREAAVPLTDIFSAASRGVIGGDAGETVAGFALQGADARQALTDLAQSFPVYVRPRDNGLELKPLQRMAAGVQSLSPIAAADGRPQPKPERRRDAGFKLPNSVAVRHYEASRDYQAGVQRSPPAIGGSTELQVELPASLETAQARRLAQNIWQRLAARLEGGTANVAVDAGRLSVGAPMSSADGQIVEIEHKRGYCQLRYESWPTAAMSPLAPGDAGRDQPSPDLAIGTTLLRLVELPLAGDPAASAPIVGVAAAGTGPGWKRAVLSQLVGDQLRELGGTATPASFGKLVAPLGYHPPIMADTTNAILIDMENVAMDLPPGSGSPNDPDAPTVAVGAELIRYAAAELVQPGRYRLSNLIRGVGGTHDAIGGYPIETQAVLIERDTLRILDLAGFGAGAAISIEATGLGDPAPVSAGITLQALALRPLAPVHLRTRRLADGSIAISWIRRSRFDPGWLDQVDMPVGEDSLAFRVAISAGATTLAAMESAESGIEITASQLAGWGLATGQNILIAVRQIGRYALSPGAETSVRL